MLFYSNIVELFSHSVVWSKTFSGCSSNFNIMKATVDKKCIVITVSTVTTGFSICTVYGEGM